MNTTCKISLKAAIVGINIIVMNNTNATKELSYYEKNKERLKAKRLSPEGQAYIKEYYLKNKDKISKGSKQRERSKNYYYAKKEACKERARSWNRRHRAELNAKARTKRMSNNNLRVLSSLRHSLWYSLKNSGNIKSQRVLDLIGCSIEELKAYIESLWVEGMSWKNYSLTGWHIDHIRPCASFDFSDIEQQKVCFHYSNLRPMWSKENVSKASLYEGIRHRYRS